MNTENIHFIPQPEWNCDFQLVQRSLQGDEAAWEQLYHSALSAVWYTARRSNFERLFSEYDLEDIVQEAFLRCYERRARFMPECRFATWACGFVRYTARNTGGRSIPF